MPQNDKITSEQTAQKKIHRTLKTPIVPNEKDPEGSISINGASDGTRHEPGVNMYAEFAQMCLHDEETIEKAKSFFEL